MDQNKDYNGPSLSLDAPEMMIDATYQNEKSISQCLLLRLYRYAANEERKKYDDQIWQAHS